ncbi:MAG: PAS domain S-box protein [Actinomycetota bacterium]|nr:PAS domain S-box protein [Actinomycetota bacterium]
MSTAGTGGSRDSLRERHRRALAALEEAEQRWRLILETANDAYIAIDADSRILDWNRQAEMLLGWSAEEVVGRSLTDTVIPDRFRDAHREGIARYRETGQGPVLFERLELPALRRDGQEVPTEVTIWPSPHADGQRFNAFLRDISERRRMRRDVHLQQRVTAAANATSDVETALRTAIEEVCRTVGWPVGHAYLADVADGDRLVPTDWWFTDGPRYQPFVDATEATAFVAGTGLPGRVLVTGEPAWIVDVVEDPNFPRSAVAAEVDLRTGMAFPVLSGDQVTAVLEFYTRERFEPDLAMLKMMGMIGTQLGRVIERQRARTDLERANADLREANDSKTRLISVVSHELRSPLTVIHGFAGLLREHWEGMDDGEKLHLLGSIERQSRRLFRLVDDLLTLSRLEAQAVDARRRSVEVGAAIGAVVADLGMDVDVEGPGDASVEVDPDHLTRVLVNLLTNARRYGAQPFRIEIRPGASGGRPHIDLRICDAGPGVDPDFVSEVFEPFTRGRMTDGEGTGLGLSIVSGLAEANRGSSWYESLEPGACFAVRLPAAP